MLSSARLTKSSKNLSTLQLPSLSTKTLSQAKDSSPLKMNKSLKKLKTQSNSLERSFFPLSSSSKNLPKMPVQEYESELDANHYRVINLLKKHKPQNGSKTLVYEMKTEGQKVYQRNLKEIRLKNTEKKLFTLDLEKAYEKRKPKEVETFLVKKMKKDQERKKNQRQWMEKVMDLRIKSKQLKQSTHYLHRNYQDYQNQIEAKTYTIEQRQNYERINKNIPMPEIVQELKMDESHSTYRIDDRADSSSVFVSEIE